MRSTMILSLTFLAVSSLVTVALGEKGSCRAARKCCDGKDGDCMVDVSAFNKVLHGSSDEEYDDEDEDVEPCYCDHSCMDVGDCCPDFKDYCGVIDCTVTEWSEWSKCDVSCGIGTSVRSREIMHPESNGGRQCPTLEEKRTCEATRCSKRHLDKVSAHRETAMLLPGKFARLHQKNYDVRSNLKSFRRRVAQPYCVVFQVDKSTKNSCRRDKDTRDLIAGNDVCVLCDSKAQKSHLGDRCTGHGAEGKRTRFKNILNSRCHGRWTRVKIVEGDCPCKGGPNFIFV